MYRTSAFLLVYVLPGVLLIAILLAVWGIRLPWYIFLIVLPVVLACFMVGVGSITLAWEEQVHGRVAQWMQRLQDLASGSSPNGTHPDEIAPRKLLQGAWGTLLYRDPAPRTIGAAQQTFSVPPPQVPLIYADYAARRLVIRQELHRIPGGLVEVIVARRRGDTEFTVFPPVRVQLQQTEPPQGEPHWYADVSLNSLIGEFEFYPGDDFIYCVKPASEGGTPTPGA